MPLPWMPLVAAGLDWLEGLLPLLFVLVWIGSQVWGVFRKLSGSGTAKPPQAGPPPRRAPRPVPAAPWPQEEPRAADADVRRDLERQIEAFLRETGGPVKPERTPPPRPVRTGRKPPPPARPRVAGPTQAAAAPPRAAPGGRPRPEHAVGSLADRTSDIARHVEDAFADDLVHRTAKAPVEPPAPVAPLAPDLVTLLRHPATLRQLMLVREVLDRPTGRW